MKSFQLTSQVSGVVQLKPNVGSSGDFVTLGKNPVVMTEEQATKYSSSISIFVSSGKILFSELGKPVEEVVKVEAKVESVEDKNNADSIASIKALVREKTLEFQNSESKEVKKALRDEIAELKKQINALK